MKTINRFFLPENYIESISEEDYRQAILVVDTVKSFNRMTYQSVYVVDYFKRNFLYVSENPLFLCGLDPAEVRERGYAFYFDHVPEDEVEILLEINRVGFELFNRTPVNERLKLSISYDFHIKYIHGQLLINHKLSPIRLAANGNIWLAACVVSFATNRNVGNIEAYMDGRDDFWTFSPGDRDWKKKKKTILQEREKDILLLAVQGYTMDQIADKMYITIDTVKFHRKNLFKRLGVSSISEALWTVAEKKLF